MHTTMHVHTTYDTFRFDRVGRGLQSHLYTSPKGAAPANVSAIQKQARGLHPTESPYTQNHFYFVTKYRIDYRA